MKRLRPSSKNENTRFENISYIFFIKSFSYILGNGIFLYCFKKAFLIVPEVEFSNLISTLYLRKLLSKIKKEKKSTTKNFLIFQEMEICSSKVKKILIFWEMELLSPSSKKTKESPPEKANSYISRN